MIMNTETKLFMFSSDLAIQGLKEELLVCDGGRK